MLKYCAAYFRNDNFSARRIKKIERLVHACLPAYRMTPDRLRRYVDAQQGADKDEWQFKVTQLEFFISRWVPILTYLLKSETVLPAEAAEEAVETTRGYPRVATIQDQVQVIIEEARRLSWDPVIYALKGPSSPFGPLGIISRLVLISDYPNNLLPALAQLGPELRNTLFDHPRCYFLLHEKLHLREWARLDNRDHRKLLHAARNQYRECYRQVGVHNMYKTT